MRRYSGSGRLAIPPAWTESMDLPFFERPYPGNRPRRQGTQAIPLSPRFREVRESTKYEHVVAFADELPSIREKVREHMGLRGLPREKVLATVVHLLEATLIRVGNDDYAKQNNSYGLTTLKNRHVAVDGNEVRFRFTGKSGKQWSLRVRDRRVAKIIRACQELPGQELIQYVDERGICQDVTSADVNDYLRRSPARTLRRRISAPGRERYWRRWPSRNLRVSTAPPRQSVISWLQSKRYPRGWAILPPFVASATFIRKF